MLLVRVAMATTRVIVLCVLMSVSAPQIPNSKTKQNVDNENGVQRGRTVISTTPSRQSCGKGTREFSLLVTFAA